MIFGGASRGTGWALLLSLASCTRTPSTPPDVGVVDARTLLEVALDARAKLSEPRFRVQLRTDIAVAFARTASASRARSELELAIAEARQLDASDDRDRALARAAHAAHGMGDRVTAERILTEIRNTDDRAELAGALATDVASASAVPSATQRERALARLAREAAVQGDTDRAAAIVARVEDGSLSAPVMGAICAALLAKGRRVDAKRMAGELDGVARSEAYAALADDAARRGDLRAAERWIDQIESELIRARATAVLAVSRPGGSNDRRRHAARALQLALEIQSQDLRTAAIEAVVRVWIDAGDAQAADTVLGTALAAPVRGRAGVTALDASGARRVRVLVATGYARSGDAAAAARVAEAIDDPVMAAEAWAAIAQACLRADRLEAALAAAARILPDELRMPAIAAIVVAPGPPPTSNVRAALGTALTR